MLLFIAVHSNLVTPDDSIQAILVAESLRDIRSELHADTSLAGTSARGGLGICPQHLHHQPSLTRLSLSMSVQLSNVVQCDIVIREQTTVEHQVLFTDQGGQGQRRETLREQLENTRMNALALPRAMISSERLDSTDRSLYFALHSPSNP